MGVFSQIVIFLSWMRKENEKQASGGKYSVCVVDGGGGVAGRRAWDGTDIVWGISRRTGHGGDIALVGNSGRVLGLGEVFGWQPAQPRTASCFLAASSFSRRLGTTGPSSWVPPWRLVKGDQQKANQKILNPCLKGILCSPGNSLL